MLLKFFKLSEFDSPDLPGSGAKMQPEFMIKLEKARELAAIPFVINSGYRTEAHNLKVKGVSGSSHTSGWAADIKCSEPRNRFIIIKSLIAAGINRIGVANGFIHCDSDPTKDKFVTWLY